MKTLSELNRLYTSELRPHLVTLEDKRIALKKKLTKMGLMILGGYVGLVLILSLVGVQMQFSLFVPAFISGIVFMILFLKFRGGYIKYFKENIIARLVTFISPGLSYTHKHFVSRGDFVDSKIFSSRPDRYKGEDYVAGKIGETKVEFSEVHAQKEHRDSKGRRSTSTIFRGLVFIADFNKHFKSETVVLPDTAESLFGGVGKFLQSVNPTRGKLIKLEDPEFEKEFVVYGDDQIEARYILSTSLMKRIVDFKKKSKQKIYLSFVGSKVYVMISIKKDLFEPHIFHTVLDFDLVREFFEDLSLATGIVDDLNLNTRIWSK